MESTRTLYFEKISRFDRVEPVECGIPFAPGELVTPEGFRLLDGDAPVPCQARVTGRWPDGSVRWLFVRALVALPGNAGKRFSFTTDGGAPVAPPEMAVRITEAADGGLRVDTGRLAFTLPAAGIWPVRDVALDGAPPWDADPFRGVRMQYGEMAHTTTEAPVTLVVEEEGPLCAVIRLDAAPPDVPGAPAVRGRVTCWAGAPWLVFQYTVADMRQEWGQTVPVRDWALDLAPEGAPATLRVAYNTRQDRVLRPEREGEGVAFRFTDLFMRSGAFEQQVDSFCLNSWADWEGPRGGVQVSVRHAAQQFPKGYAAMPTRLTAELYPPTEDTPLEWFAGTAKTHELLLHFHAPGTSDEALSTRALQFHIPDVAMLPPSRYANAGIWLPRVFTGPEVRRVINLYAAMGDNRPVGLGVFNFGDEYDLGYTHQGRGLVGGDEGDSLVWLNNEYDVTHHFYLFFARTGLRRFRDYAINSARHWMDVDINHSASDPALRGGHLTHMWRHAGRVFAILSHQWVQGLFDTYHFTGDPDALAAAIGVADNIAYQVEHSDYLKPGNVATREVGWPLRAMLFAWRETGNPRYRDLAQRLVGLFEEWDTGGGALLAPYTTHTQVRKPFRNSLSGVSLALWALETGDETARRIAIAIADDLIAHGLLPWGLPYYKELPSLQRKAQGMSVLELLSYVYRLTGDRQYLEAGLPQLEDGLGLDSYHLGSLRKHSMTNGIFTSPYLEPHGGKFFAMSLPAVLQFIAVAESETLARGLDYQLQL